MPPLKWKPEWNALLGTDSDRAIGRRIGMASKTVGYYRTRLGIAQAPRIFKKLPQHEVACVSCGAKFKRATYWKEPKCHKCRRAYWLKYNADRWKLLRDQGRRYRIIMHILGWEEAQFAEMIAEMRASPMAFRRGPETRSARIDLKWERKKARAA